ncbi:dynactin 50 kDa subunit [Heterostelium album PN500]|uniref:Dynactin 50 kDa subunit n=1 Tax=Heterostelium pallidum (strain ATCC 26659 / Pp 5 / PN500) TaxID=670386 RepID=D3BPR8_HETP5|nr:dynactin 50 kDa subunit [Heterostelium album PN500]EFA76630.1 dynactin 50 kDa subunit [Heterostelium album PN500]|eukprot:XP_020428762.1 dynactin 50 kDa subunit [Heterostelium album PN500]
MKRVNVAPTNRAPATVAKGGNGNNMLRYYSEDAIGLKVGPQAVLIASLSFIGFVILLHIWVYKQNMSKESKRILNLPDIDPTQPDSFETPDVPEAATIVVDEPELVNENIERVSLVPSKAFAKFANKKLTNDGEDFSDSIYKKPTKRHFKSQTVFDIIPSDATDADKKTETPLQKYQRLQFEVQSLRDEVQIIADSNGEVEQGIKGVEMAHQLAELQNQLSLLLDNDKLRPILDENRQILHYSQLGGDTSKTLINGIKSFTESSGETADNNKDKSDSAAATSATSANHVKYELYYTGDQAKYQQLQRLTDLDKRLAQLETLLGNKTELSIPLTQSLVEIKEKLALLDSSKLDVLQQKMKLVTKQMESVKVQDESVTKSLTTNESKINSIYELMNRWDVIGQQLPTVINRLYTLRSLHEEGLSFSNHITQLDKEQSNITSLLKTNSTVMNKMDESFKSNMQTIQLNVEALEKRINELTKK